MSAASVKDFKILPLLEIQQKIADVLDKAQELIDKRKEQIIKLDEFIQSVFLDMFGDPVLNSKNWEVSKLSEIATYFIGLTYKPVDVSKEGLIVLRSSNIQNGMLDFNDIVRIKKNVKDNFIVKDFDILMCSRNGSRHLVGKTALIKDLNEKMTFGAFMTIISKYYLYLLNYFRTDGFRRQIFTSETTTVNQITKTYLTTFLYQFHQ